MSFKRVSEMSQLSGCSIIEGSLIFSLGIYDQSHQSPNLRSVPDLNVTFPELREITDYLVIYQSRALPRLTNILPNLAVIRGHKLLEVRPQFHPQC